MKQHNLYIYIPTLNKCYVLTNLLIYARKFEIVDGEIQVQLNDEIKKEVHTYGSCQGKTIFDRKFLQGRYEFLGLIFQRRPGIGTSSLSDRS